MSKKHYYFITLTNAYVFDEDLRKVKDEGIKFNLDSFESIKEKKISEFKEEFENISKPPIKELRRILNIIRGQDKKEMRKRLRSLMKKKISESFGDDDLIKLTVTTIEEMEKSFNIIFSRLREYYSLYLPEIKNVNDKARYIDLTLLDKSEILKKLGLDDSMGADLNEEDISEINSLSKIAKDTLENINDKENYLEKLMKKNYPRFTKLAGFKIGAKLLKRAGSGLSLAKLPSSSIQIYGAESALFKHMKYGSNPPKYGIIYNHPKVNSAKNKGKAARRLANDLSKKIRIDVFRDE